MELIQSKSLLAKLMATENILVEQRSVKTASFDVGNRVLTVPILDNKISGYLYDLFMGHEVGHALHTPLEGLKKSHELKISHSILNVVEDARIERKIKDKYPGLRNSFYRGYNELTEKNFFGTSGINLNDMNFIDRVNIYFKAGATTGIKFNDKERLLVNEVNSTQTFDEVLILCQKIMDLMKEQKEEKQKNNSGEDDIDDMSDSVDSEYKGEDEEFEDGEFDENDIYTSDKGVIDNDENESDTTTGSTHKKLKDYEEIRSFTDESFRENESKLYANNNKNYYYGNIPDIDIQQLIVPYKTIWNRYHEFTLEELNYKSEPLLVDTKDFHKIRKDANKVVSYLVKEFELRKNADQLKRASVAKTGELNMDKIFSYGFSEDIFKKITVIPGGKSHGLVMFLDWSGSMANSFSNTLKQLINLIMFCRKVNIPFEVYAFTSSYDNPYKPEFIEGEISFNCGFKLMNLFSSKMSAAEFTFAGAALVEDAKSGHVTPYWFQKAQTPLHETIIAAMKIIPEFQKQYKLQLVNTVFLTDGEGQPLKRVYELKKYDDGSSYKTETGGRGEILVLRDPVTKNQEIVDFSSWNDKELTAAYIKLLKARTGCNVIGFFIISGRAFSKEARQYFPPTVDFNDINAKFRKEKYSIVTSAGFDEYYLLSSEGMNTEEDVTFEVKENATTRGFVTAFSKYTSNRISNRVVLNRFIGLIA